MNSLEGAEILPIIQYLHKGFSEALLYSATSEALLNLCRYCGTQLQPYLNDFFKLLQSLLESFPKK